VEPVVPEQDHALSGLADRLAAAAIERMFESAAAVARLHPRARKQRRALDIVHDVPYLPSGERAHLLDIYRPTMHPGPWPVVVYIHGGSFRILSKDTHWVPGVQLAREGFLTFVVNYRLAPAHRFPAAFEDVADAVAWVMKSAPDHGGDTTKLVLAGESAGANLALALAIAATYERPEPFARRVFDSGVAPKVIAPACGILQVSSPERFRAADGARTGRIAELVYGRIAGVGGAYLPDDHPDEPSLADPLWILEEASTRSKRPFPAVTAGVGDKDPIRADTDRLASALAKLGVDHEVKVYPGAHAFQMLVWQAAAKAYWRDTSVFLNERLRRTGSPAGR
jgi:acetyl esterase